MAKILLKNPEQTADLGKMLAKLLPICEFPAIFARGELGSGKTDLASHIVRNLPGGEQAEVSSPSFTICNYYPTSPASLHCDLYRCQGNLPDDILEMACGGRVWLYVEWAEYFPREYLPKEFLDISFNMVKNSRLLEISPHGENPRQLAEALMEKWPPIHG